MDNANPAESSPGSERGQVDSQSTKTALRATIRARLSEMPAAARVAASHSICAILKQQRVWRSANTILFFAPLPSEPDVWPLLRDALLGDKTVALPRFSTRTHDYTAAIVKNPESELRSGQFGIREPGVPCPEIALNRLDLVLVPGVAFDARGRRLGRGKGFYDRLLSAVKGTKCGVAFDEQIVEAVPVVPSDVLVNCILTPTRWIET